MEPLLSIMDIIIMDPKATKSDTDANSRKSFEFVRIRRRKENDSLKKKLNGILILSHRFYKKK